MLDPDVLPSFEPRRVRPYIHFFGARYTGHSLAGRADLIGKPMRLYLDTGDVRALRVFDAAGRELCVVEVQGAWRYTAHTLRMRRVILALVRARKLRIEHNDDPVQCYLDYLRHAAARRRRSASKAEIARRYRTVFGKVSIESPQLRACKCRLDFPYDLGCSTWSKEESLALA